jgi:signal peptidase I
MERSEKASFQKENQMDNELQNEIQIESTNETEPIAPPSEIDIQSANEKGSIAPPTEKKKSGCGFYIFLAVFAVLVFGFRIWWKNSFGGVQVDGDSMNQTLQDGESLLMRYIKDGQGLERGDVIVVSVGDYAEFANTNVEYIIKRLIAIEGDKVKCTDGQISICYAGTQEYVPLEESYAYYDGIVGLDKDDYDFAEYTVGEGEIFFLGDNRHNSCDSRYQEYGGSHLNGKLYKATDVYGVVPDWAMEHREILANLFFN